MSFAALAVVVLASFLHATWNLLAKRAAVAGTAFVFAYNLASAVAFAPVAGWMIAHACAHAATSYAASAPHATLWSGGALACILASGVVHLGYALCLQRGYQVADLSVVYPVARGTGPLLSSLGAFVLLGETPTVAGVLGLLAVVVGILLISTQGDVAAFARPGGRAGVAWGTATGGLIAAYTIIDATAVTRFGLSPMIVNWTSPLLQAALLAPWVARHRATTRARLEGRWGVALAVGLLSPLAYTLVLSALEMGAPLAAVAPAREMSMMVGALMGVVVLHESVGLWRYVGCGVMILGVVLLGRS